MINLVPQVLSEATFHTPKDLDDAIDHLMKMLPNWSVMQDPVPMTFPATAKLRYHLNTKMLEMKF